MAVQTQQDNSMREFAIYDSVLADAAERAADGDFQRALAILLEVDSPHHQSSPPDGLVRLLIDRAGAERFVSALAATLSIETSVLAPEFEDYLQIRAGQEVLLTGAEALATVLAASGIRRVFAYAGTSELALCDRFIRTPGMQLINGRGDKESAFMAAGASLVRPARGAAIIHGARGLTNATGAIADARRNEIGCVIVVGMPSTKSARFLPPHGEPDLIETVGRFAKWGFEIRPPAEERGAQRDLAEAFLAAISEAVREASTRPCGPV